jgi:hypothetical protein
MLTLGSLLPIPASAAANPISYENDVQAVIAKSGCNLGTCHGNATGKGGFKMSLRGDDLDYDFAALVQDASGRRINLMQPENSLLLLKATQGIAHEGGKRFDTNSWEYRILRDWIAQGATRDQPGAPTLTALKVSPLQQILVAPAKSVQLNVVAKFSDGSEQDVAAKAVYEPAQIGLVKISHSGLVTSLQPGEATIIVRFLKQQQAVTLNFVPENPTFAWKPTRQNNFIDRHIFAKLKSLRMNPSPLASDEVYQRRAHLDLLGIPPSAEEARAFKADKSPDKRERLVDKLLARPEFADFWTLKWADALRVESRTMDKTGMTKFHAWIRDAVATNRPVNQFVKEILAAEGSTYEVPQSNFYRAMRAPNARAEGIARIFLGTRLQCAQCHNHPFDRWTQDDYFNWSAVFSRIDYKIISQEGVDKNDKHAFNGEQVVQINPKAKLENPRTGSPAQAKLLGAADLDPKALEEKRDLQAAAEWVTGPHNPLFAQAQVNRIWFHLMGRGLVDPVDDFRATNPASHPALLRELADTFVKSGYDMRHMIRLIMNSRSYQLSSEPNDSNHTDQVNYSHALIRRLTAEQLLDTLNQFAGVPAKFADFPQYSRASQLPGPIHQRRRDANRDDSMAFLQQFGQPPRMLACECERTDDTTMGQAFSLIGSPQISTLITREDNLLRTLQSQKLPSTEIINTLFWSALTRAPSPSEKEKLTAYLDSSPDQRVALEDIAWSLINAKEFVLRH